MLFPLATESSVSARTLRCSSTVVAKTPRRQYCRPTPRGVTPRATPREHPRYAASGTSSWSRVALAVWTSWRWMCTGWKNLCGHLPGNTPYFIFNFYWLARVFSYLFCHDSEDDIGIAPNYAELGNWSAHPERRHGTRDVEDANHLAPPGNVLEAAEGRSCDCFFVHDSTTLPAEFRRAPTEIGGRWNAPVVASAGTPMADYADKVAEQADMRVAVAASCFSGACRIYAPRYRQAHLLTYSSCLMELFPTRLIEFLGWSITTAYGNPTGKRGYHRRGDCHKAYEVAYSDVRRAFVHVVDDPANAERPFCLASHSQGSMHLLRLLQEEVEPYPQRVRRFVHAYVGGWAVSKSLFGRTLHEIIPSSSSRDTCSVSSWRTASPHHQDWVALICTMGYLAYVRGEGWECTKKPLLATNPVTWSAEADVAPSDPAMHKGAFYPVPANFDQTSHLGWLAAGAALRFSALSASTSKPMGIKMPSLSRVDCGAVAARVDEIGMTRVQELPKDCLFALTEFDWLLYHDLDFCLFAGNVRHNIGERLGAWLAKRS